MCYTMAMENENELFFRVSPDLYSDYENMEPKTNPFFCWKLSTIYDAVERIDPLTAKKRQSKKESPKTDGKSRMLFALELHILGIVQMRGYLVNKHNKFVSNELMDLKDVLLSQSLTNVENLPDYQKDDCVEMLSRLTVSSKTKPPTKTTIQRRARIT